MLAQALAGLISFEPGSIIFGIHLSKPVKQLHEYPDGFSVYYYSPDSRKEMWDGEVFEKGKVKVEVLLRTIDPGSPDLTEIYSRYEWLVWSVTRF